MEVIVPVDVLLYSSNVSETTYNEYDYTGGTTYSAGDRVKVSYESDGTTERTPHQVYEALTSTSNYPPLHPTEWVYVSSTNRWKMFDSYVNRQTERADYIEVTIDSSRCDRVCLANVVASTISVTVQDDASGETYSTSVNMYEDGAATSWSEYFFGGVSYKDYKVIHIPVYFSGRVTVKISKENSTAKCGILRCGKAYFIGYTKYDASASIIDYSKKDTYDYGETYLAQGNYAKRLDIDVFSRAGAFRAIQRKLAEIRATEVCFDANNSSGDCGGTDQSALEVFGFIREFQDVYKTATTVNCRLTIEGLI